ncbi:hypothetical protein [Ruminococcus sp.]|jgi:hypothetical protein|nr:hypothetical protein [Ruminococcus sp.]
MSKFTELTAKEMNATDGGLLVLPLVPLIVIGAGAVAGYVGAALKK